MTECFKCGESDDLEQIGRTHICSACAPETDTEDDGSDAETPGADPNGPASTAAEPGDGALPTAIEWFHQQLDRPLPDGAEYDTPRDYYHGRGWVDETIKTKRLGYAPDDTRDQLLAYLFGEGFTRDEILSTGLFREWDDGNISATWSGRFVLPYLDGDETPRFAISRRTTPAHPEDWAGRYDDDDDPAKYHKLPVSREEVTVEEPIFGLDTVREGEPVLITEGIADAITAHQAGYACVSPVTTSFKKTDRERLVEVLETRCVPRVYIIQDAERATSDVVADRDGWDALNVEQHGEGAKGAVRTAEYLTTRGFDARVGTLPRPGLDKVDLDDYLGEWADTLAPVLAGAKPGDERPAYAETAPSPSPSTSASVAESWGGSEASSSGGSGASSRRNSRLWIGFRENCSST